MNRLQLEYFGELKINVAAPKPTDETGIGHSNVIPLTGGTFNGPKLRGIILPGGADWQLIKDAEVAEINARYTLEADDGTLIYISNKGMRVASPEVLKKISSGEVVPPDAYYFRTVPVFEVAKGKYDWLMKSLFIAKGIRNPDNVTIQVWCVL
ncbi:DUF3237 domain-containing protein [Ferruginibacter paludis]|uniref:DUF3237 domain-containing protein n=1 Tax=Ferruginibacter paludis TaxID=1310417 RepID=UPI0025B2FCA9|nr:DUF3237 domain-containing protein [Ferruginibacter paludis]MDN3657612.1 DUF3237 domain-containing protein [Ferruginibacter paludis]